jgi:hypothetical protein
MGERGGFQRGFSAFNYRSELGLGWASSEAIGRRGRCLGTASWAGSRGLVIGVGGWPVRSQWRWFQSGYGEFQTQPGRVCARGCWAMVASCCGFDAV